MPVTLELNTLSAFASLAVAANISYLNLPNFRYRKEISELAQITAKQLPKDDNSSINQSRDFLLINELAAMDGDKHPLGDKPEASPNLQWDSPDAATYFKWFHHHRDIKTCTAALWFSCSYLGLSSMCGAGYSSGATASLMFFISITSLIASALVYFLCNTKRSDHVFTLAREKNFKMIAPSLVVLFGACILFFIEWYEVPTKAFIVQNTGPWIRDVAIIAGKLTVVISICMMAFTTILPLQLMKRGIGVVEAAKKRISKAEAALSGYVKQVIDKIETELDDVKGA